jgi:GH24 family phage-related lysozyme (muramidase)
LSKIQLRQAAKHYKELPHQMAAWDWLQAQLPETVIEEFAELYRADPALSQPLPPAWLAPSLKIIKEYEGLRLEAYKCPAGVPTIGYGTTRFHNRPVRMGDVITQQSAEELLQNDLQQLFAPGLFELLPQAKKWRPNQIAALLSFAYNLGLGALEASTLRKRLLAGEESSKVVREELPKWVHAGEAVLAGLERRRKAEVALFCGQPQPPKAPEVQQGSPRLTPSSPFSARLTPNIRLGEFALDQADRRFDQQHQVDTAIELANFLERVRRNFMGLPVIITSGYRPKAVNAAVGGATNSEHLYSCPKEGAVDFYLDGADVNDVQAFCDRYWPYSVGYGAPKGFVHLGRRADGIRRRWDY